MIFFLDVRNHGWLTPNFQISKMNDTPKVLEENDLLDSVVVQDCECQGECGYGPNLLLDGKMVNRVKGKDAVEKALGLAVEQAE
jgi:NADH:ubiquinone oxidoreductase subunit E